MLFQQNLCVCACVHALACGFACKHFEEVLKFNRRFFLFYTVFLFFSCERVLLEPSAGFGYKCGDWEGGVQCCPLRARYAVLYTVCLVPNNSDTETCPLIAHNGSHCCVCGSDGEGALGGGMNTSLGLTPADANWPGVPSCIVLSQFPLTLDCFLLGEVASLRKFTGSILYYDLSASTDEASSTIEFDQKFIIIALSIVCAVIVCITSVCCVIICVLSALLHHEKQKNVQSASDTQNIDRQSGLGERHKVAASEFNLACSCVCICTYFCFSQIPPPALYLSFRTFISVARFSGYYEKLKLNP